MSQKRILITGAAGFLGSHLCDRFIKEGYYVIAMDNLITGDMMNIEHLSSNPNFEFIHHDITRFIDIKGDLDYILHFASPASPIDYLKIPIQTLKVGAMGTHNCLGLAKAKGARILVASTSEVYGDPLVHPQTEEYWGNVNPVGPRGVYDEAKRYMESITMAYHTFHNVETRIIRIFNTYGPRMRLNDGRVIPAFIGQALRGEDLTIFGDGMQTRSFCYVDDQVEGIFRLLHSDYVYPVNIGNPDEITIKDFAEEIARLNSYDLIPATLPTGKGGARLNDMQYRKRAVAISLANQGFTEVINYPFVSQEMVDLLGFTGDRAKSFKIANPMSEEFPLLRTHLLPGLLTTAVRNIGRGSKNLAIFEIGTIFRNTTPLGKAVNPGISKRPSEKVIKDIYDGVPKQMLFVGAVVTGETILSDWQGSGSKFNWSDAIAKAQEIIESTGNDYEIFSSDLAPWHPGRCAELRVNGKPVAHAGELHPRVITALNLPERSCAFAVILSELPSAGVTKAPAIWSFPAVVQDVALVVESKISAADLTAAIKQGAGPLLESIVLFDRYDQMAGNKVSLAFTLTFRASDRTLTSDEVALYRDQAIAQAAKSVGAVLRGNA